MNLQIVRAGEAVPSPEETQARLITGLAVAEAVEAVAHSGEVAVYATFDAASPATEAACRASDGKEAVFSETGRVLACPNNEVEADAEGAAVLTAIRKPVEGVLLDAPDGWYAAGSRGAGFCTACEERLRIELMREYGEQIVPGTILPAIAASDEKALFWREREALRLTSAVEHGRRLLRQVRDEGRRERDLNLQVGGRLLGVSPAAVLLARRLDFAVIPAETPSVDRASVGAYEIFRAVLGRRPLTPRASEALAANPQLVRQAARIASSVGAELTLPANAPAASHSALTLHRQFWKELRSRYRPADALAEVLLLYSPQSDHWSRGTHGASVIALTEALSRLAIQYRVITEIPRTGTEPIVLVDAAYLPEEDATRLDRRITEGAGAIVIGEVGTADKTGRTLSGPFTELSAGLNRVGAGTVISLDKTALDPGLDKALESLLGRGRRAVSVSRPSVLVKMFVDPDRKLDVHLVGRRFDEATGRPEEVKGLTLHLAGSAVSGARTGYLFTQEAPERKVALTAFGMGVQATVPDFQGAAVLTVSR